MTPDAARGGFVVRNPLNGKRRRYSAAQEALARETALLLAQLVDVRRQRALMDAGKPTVASIVDGWRRDRLPRQPWDASTRRTAEWRLARIDKEFGDRLAHDCDCLFLETWLAKTARRADPFNKWRQLLVLLWRYAVSQKLVPTNEAEKVERRSTSRKIAGNRKTRQQLDVAGFQAIHAAAPAWLRLAMEASLVTLQARREVCGIRHADFRDGFLFIIRDKVAGDSAMAFIKIRLTAELEDLRARARKLDDIVSPYLVHRAPARRQRRWMEGKAHWTAVNEHYLTQAFAAARDSIERYQLVPEKERPSFHEIRGLGARLYEDRGVAKPQIQALMTHSSPRTTEIYLERGAGALSDEDFRSVSAPFTVRDLLGGGS